MGIVAVELIFGHWFAAKPGLALLRIPRNVEIAFDDSALAATGGLKRYRRDRYGLRGRYDDLSRIDILAIGGSTTNERYVGEGETWTDGLAANFSRHGKPMTVVNAGVDGHSTVGHIRSFDVWFPTIPRLQARYILVYAGINDVLVHVEGRERLDELDTNPSLLRRIGRHIQDRSVLYDVHRMVSGMLLARSAHLVHGNIQWHRVHWEDHALPQPLADETSLKRRDDYGDRLALLIARIRRFGAQAIVVTQQQAGYRRAGERLLLARGPGIAPSLADYQLLTAFNDRAMQVCRAHAAICIDLGAELVFEDGDFYDRFHTTAQGSHRIAAYLFRKLKDVVR